MLEAPSVEATIDIVRRAGLSPERIVEAEPAPKVRDASRPPSHGRGGYVVRVGTKDSALHGWRGRMRSGAERSGYVEDPGQMRIRRSPVAQILVAIVAVLLLAGTALAIQSGGVDLKGSSLSAPGASKAPKAAHPDSSEEPEGSEAPDEADGPEGSGGPPSADEVARIVDKLKAAGITATASGMADLAAKVGVGGAVRVYAFAHASGKTPAEILAMFQAGKGWGEIDHELGLSIGPGIGWIMGHGGGPEASDKPGG